MHLGICPRVAAAKSLKCISRAAKMTYMSAVAGRRHHRLGPDDPTPVLMQGRVHPAVRAKANAAAQAAGITLAKYLERLVERDEVDRNGCPLWLPPANAQQELPLKTA